MKKLVALILYLVALLPLNAQEKEHSWVCAVEWTESMPEWVFVYDDIKRNSDGDFLVFIKWEFDNDDSKHKSAKQTWIISPDFSEVKIVKSVGYNADGKVVYSEDSPYGDWSYVMPDTYAEAIVGTAKEILLKR